MRNEELLLFVFAGAILYYQLSRSSVKSLLSMLLMVIFVGGVFYYVIRQVNADKKTVQATSQQLQQSLEGRKEMVSDAYPVKRVNGKIRYLPKNAVFMDIVKDLRFLRVFDKARYGDLIVHLDKMQKVYMYILARRYSCQQHVPLFIDLRDYVSELLYSLYLIVPETLKHTYGLNPHNTIERNVTEFTAVSRRMLEILKGFCKDEGEHWPENLPRAYEPNRQHRMP